jgi:hypothetical protein
MKRWGLWVGVGIVLLAAIALIGWGGAYIPPLTSSASEAWSRGKILGVTPVNVRVDVHTAPDGIFLCWVDLNDQLHMAQLGTRGQVISERTPALGTDVPRDPQLAVGPGGEIHLIWRETGGERSLLTYAQLNSTFSVRVDPFFISPVGDKAQSPNLAFNRRGEIEVFWSGQAGIYHTTLNAAGETLGEPVLLVEDGEEVSVQVDQKGIFHLAWLQTLGANKAIYFASFDPDRRDLSQPEGMVQLVLKAGQTVPSLSVGIDTDTGYVLWVIQDSKSVFSKAQYAFFPLEIPRQKKIRDLELDAGGNPQGLWPVRGQFETLLIALTETVMTEDGPQLQIAIVPLHGEQTSGDQAWAMPGSRASGNLKLVVSGFRDLGAASQAVQDDLSDQYIVTASERPSLRPTLVIDESGEMHLTWLESGGFGRYQVAYASTAAGVKEVYGRPTWWDVANRVLEIAMHFFMAVGLTPVLAIYWSLVPLGWLLLYLFVAGREHLTTPGAWVAFGIAILLEMTSTYLYYPHRSRMPPLLQWSAPLGTAAVGLILALLSLRRREEKSLFGAFFVFAIVHGILQVMCFVLVR